MNSNSKPEFYANRCPVCGNESEHRSMAESERQWKMFNPLGIVHLCDTDKALRDLIKGLRFVLSERQRARAAKKYLAKRKLQAV